MVTGKMTRLLQNLRKTVQSRDGTDADLLATFLAQRDEDAFQATFLVLVRKSAPRFEVTGEKKQESQ